MKLPGKIKSDVKNCASFVAVAVGMANIETQRPLFFVTTGGTVLLYEDNHHKLFRKSLLTMMFNLQALLTTTSLFTISIITITTTHAIEFDIHPGAVAAIFRNYDIDEDETFPNCQPLYVAESVCPKDEKTACGPMKGIEKFCKKTIGEDETLRLKDVPGGEKENAIEGCKKFVSYRFDKEREKYQSCCGTVYCQDYYAELLLKQNEDDGSDEL